MTTLTLTAADGFRSDAYLAQPAGTPQGALVVLQEIYGVNTHIRSVADRFAAAGWLAIAPALFDRVERGVDMSYTETNGDRGMALKAAIEALPAPGVLQDIQAAVDAVARAGKVGVVGYCWGGLQAWRAAEQVRGLSAAVCYYGGGMTRGAEAGRQPKVPVMAHFGEQDGNIPADGVRAFAAAHPEVEVHLYQAGHAFNCDLRDAYAAGPAAAALERTLFHFDKHLA